ncbi:hypothetical protein J6590_031236 [Homalodisca vitripennis]|nr:hypothetical protein J6590_031236 [Homalodisca vitripennis]
MHDVTSDENNSSYSTKGLNELNELTKAVQAEKYFAAQHRAMLPHRPLPPLLTAVIRLWSTGKHFTAGYLAVCGFNGVLQHTTRGRVLVNRALSATFYG